MSGSVSTNVPAPVFGDTGFVAPAESALLDGALADLNAAFGGNLRIANADGSRALTTPQGQLASSMAAALGDANALFVSLANGVDPAFASGRMQDAIGRIYFIERFPATSTVVPAACTGAAGTVIPNGGLIQDANGNQYSTTGGTIPAGGSLPLSFSCTSTGPVACPAQTFRIVRTVPGWDTAISSSAGVPGSNVESRADFEARRRASVAVNARDSVEAIRGAVLSVSGVLDAYVVDNPSSAAVTVGRVTLSPHSVYVAATGGDPSAIAQAIWNKKSLGCDTVGTTTVTVTDSTAYTAPLPTYQVSFTAPTPTAISFAITLANGPGVPANAILLVQKAIISAMAGGDGGPRARIGSTVFASRFYSTVAALGSWAQILSIQLGAGAPNGFSVTLPINEAPVTAASNITLQLI